MEWPIWPRSSITVCWCHFLPYFLLPCEVIFVGGFFFLRTTKTFPVILPFRSNSPPPTPLLSVTEKKTQTNVEVKMIERDHRKSKSKRKWERKEKKIRGGASLSESQPTCILSFYCCSVSQNKARGIQPFCCPSVFCPVVVLTVDSEAKQRTEGHSCFVSILLESKKGNKKKTFRIGVIHFDILVFSLVTWF